MLNLETIKAVMEIPAIQDALKHVATLNEEMGDVSIKLAMLSERVEWLCRFFWLTTGAIISIVITQIWQILILKRNGNNK